MSEPFTAIERHIFRNRGSLYEGDTFSILLLSPFVARSFEFALGDGVVDCSREYPTTMSYGERFWDLYQRRHPGPLSEASELLLFDVKSSVGDNAKDTQGNQIYVTGIGQRRRVAFYVGMCAADPLFVDLIPNYHQEKEALEQPLNQNPDLDERRAVAVNPARLAKLPTSAYGGLDQSLCPYRMPLAMLPEAIKRVRNCVLTGEPYENPWTKVVFDDWQPHTTFSTRWFTPEGRDQFSAYQAVMDIYRAAVSEQTLLVPGLLGLQPRIADFKLLLRDKQYFIQHKIDGTRRAKNTPLEKVPMCRGAGKKRFFYLSAFDRFDFLWYQLSIADGVGTQTRFFFLPERLIPDHFYSDTRSSQSFEREDFMPYYFHLDKEGNWISEVERVISENPAPRKPGERKLRRLDPVEIVAEIVDHPQLPEVSQLSMKEKPSSGASSSFTKGRSAHARVTKSWHRRFFYGIMTMCAERKSGLLVVLAPNHPLGDFGFMRYRWTATEIDRFWRLGRPPVYAHHITGDVQMVAVCCYSQAAESFFQGPNVRSPEFRRLDSCSQKRLVAWDLAGLDSCTDATATEDLPVAPQQFMPAMIPTEDISATEAQRALFAQNLAIKTGEWNVKTPNLSSLLRTGLFASEYAIGNGGPAGSQAEGWEAVWMLLHRFAGSDGFQHPAGHDRVPSEYRHSMTAFNQRLADQHSRQGEMCEEDVEDELT